MERFKTMLYSILKGVQNGGGYYIFEYFEYFDSIIIATCVFSNNNTNCKTHTSDLVHRGAIYGKHPMLFELIRKNNTH